MVKEFRPAFLFLAKFLAIYFIGNLIYGIFIESFRDKPDPLTWSATKQSAVVLNLIGFETSAVINPLAPTVFLKENNKTVLNVYEGCNGVNVMIVFVAFLFAFRGSLRTLLWFLPLGILVIHAANLARICLLFYSAIYNEQYFYYFHKYFFTAILYLIVFILWGFWAIRLYNKKSVQQVSTHMEEH